MRVEGLSDAEIALRPHRIGGPAANALLDRGAIMPGRAIAYAPEAPKPTTTLFGYALRARSKRRSTDESGSI